MSLIRALFVVALRVVLAVTRQHCDLTAAHRNGGAGVESGLRWRLVGAIFEGRVVEVAVAAQPRGGAALYASDDRIEVGDRRRGRRVKQHATARVARKHTIEHHQVEVNVQVHR